MNRKPIKFRPTFIVFTSVPDIPRKPVITAKKDSWDSHDVYWYCDRYKRPIAYSTVAASDLISVIYHEGYHTPNEIITQIHYDIEALKVLQQYISIGEGDTDLKVR